MPFPTSRLVQSRKYTDVQLVGQGADGNVYRAKDNVDRLVAVKEALPTQHFIHNKFRKEARILASLKDSNIIAFHHLEEDAQTHELYLICEFANGRSLADYLAMHGKLSEQQAIKVTINICKALEATWSQKIVHRDVKPSNVLLFLDDQGNISSAKLGDFGIAHDRKRPPTTIHPIMAHHPGTPEYMAREMWDVRIILDVRADIYALGITLWEMLTNEDYKVVAGNGTPNLKVYNPATSDAIAHVIQQAVEDDRGQRFQTPEKMAQALRDVQSGTYKAPLTVTFPRPPSPPVYSRPTSLVNRTGVARFVPLMLTAVLLLGGGAWASRMLSNLSIGGVPVPPVVTITNTPPQEVIASLPTRTPAPTETVTLEPTPTSTLEPTITVTLEPTPTSTLEPPTMTLEPTTATIPADPNTITTPSGLSITVLGGTFDKEGRFRIKVNVLNHSSQRVDLYEKVFLVDNLKREYALTPPPFLRADRLLETVSAGRQVSGDVATDMELDPNATTMAIVFTFDGKEYPTSFVNIPAR